jgi:hypothetical protein
MKKKDLEKLVGYRVCTYNFDKRRWVHHEDAKSITAAMRVIKSLMKDEGLEVKVKVEKLRLIDTLFVVRLYDSFDGWIDVSGPLTKDEAEKIKTEKSRTLPRGPYQARTYYDVFPANTRMLVTPEYLGR